MFENAQQFRDWSKLQEAIDEASEIPPCTNYPDAWFPEHSYENLTEANMAIKMCKTQCPVMTECAIYGIKWEKDGIWGGLTARERIRIRNRNEIKVPRKVRVVERV